MTLMAQTHKEESPRDWGLCIFSISASINSFSHGDLQGVKKKKGQLHVLKTAPLLLSMYMVIYTETPSKKSTLQLW